MAVRSVSLQQVEIPKPCPMKWEELDGDDGERFCGQCQKHVYNLEALPRERAEDIVAGRCCVRVTRDEAGRVLTRDDRKRTRLERMFNRRGLRWVYGLLLVALPMLFAGCEKGMVMAGTPQPPTTAPSVPGGVQLMGEALPPVMGTPPATQPGLRAKLGEARVEMGDVALPPTTQKSPG